MIVISGFERGLGEADVGPWWIRPSHFSLVDDVSGEAFPVERARGLVTTAARLSVDNLPVLIEGAFVVPLDYSGHIWHAAIADFQIIAVEDLSQFRVRREVLVYEVQESATDVRSDILTKRRVEPYDVALSFI